MRRPPSVNLSSRAREDRMSMSRAAHGYDYDEPHDAMLFCVSMLGVVVFVM